MFKLKNFICQILLGINIIFLLYYSVQLLLFTDEFAIKNIGFFNHAVAGLSEIIGIIFFALAMGLGIIIFKGAKNQLPMLMSILLIQVIIALNFWRYVLTNSPGQTDINTITFNAYVFSIMSLNMLILILTTNKL